MIRQSKPVESRPPLPPGDDLDGPPDALGDPADGLVARIAVERRVERLPEEPPIGLAVEPPPPHVRPAEEVRLSEEVTEGLDVGVFDDEFGDVLDRVLL